MSKEDLLKVLADMQACRDHYDIPRADADLADVVIKRLNTILQDSEAVRADIERLVETRVMVSGEALNHPTIQVIIDANRNSTLGFLGLLNGIVGVRAEDERGYIAAEFRDDGRLERFVRTP
jgi:hypothetical protein